MNRDPLPSHRLAPMSRRLHTARQEEHSKCHKNDDRNYVKSVPAISAEIVVPVGIRRARAVLDIRETKDKQGEQEAQATEDSERDRRMPPHLHTANQEEGSECCQNDYRDCLPSRSTDKDEQSYQEEQTTQKRVRYLSTTACVWRRRIRALFNLLRFIQYPGYVGQCLFNRDTAV
jgi:hypothetical protein